MPGSKHSQITLETINAIVSPAESKIIRFTRLQRGAVGILLVLALSSCAGKNTLPTPIAPPLQDTAQADTLAEAPLEEQVPAVGSGPGAEDPALSITETSSSFSPEQIPTAGGSTGSVNLTPSPTLLIPTATQSTEATSSAPTPAVAAGVASNTPGSSGAVKTATPTHTSTFTPEPAKVRSSYEIQFVAFMVARNESGKNLPWLNCAGPGNYNSPGGCKQLTGSTSDFAYSTNTRLDSVFIEGGKVYLAPNGIVAPHYFIVDTTNTWWVSPSFDGLQLIRWCSVIDNKRTYYLNLYDFNADPAYDLWEMDILDYFQSPGRGALPQPLQCPG